MNRYIDADALIKRIQDEHKFGSLMLSNMIAEQPTTDVVERKRGEWKDIHAKVGTCSICDCRTNLWNFCPYCGADMRGEENGEHD